VKVFSTWFTIGFAGACSADSGSAV